MKNKFIYAMIITACCFFISFLSTSCSDWTDTESLTIIDPDIKKQNPELYADYLQNLKEYRKSDHKIVYAWFDNSEKVPFNRAQHIDNLPDSIDVVVLTHPDSLDDLELNEIRNVRQDKDMKVIFSLDYDALKLNYDNKMAELKDNEEETTVQEDFLSHLLDTLGYSLKLVDTYGYDGIIVGYNGKSLLHMTANEKEEYISNENTYIGIIHSWINTHKDKMLVFAGKPQNLVDKTILNLCKHIIIETSGATSGGQLTYDITRACTEGVPTDRFIVTAETTSLDQSDTKTGYWTDGTRAVPSSALWATATFPNFTIAGLGIYNINNDYYNVRRVYNYTKTAIYTLNPSFKSK
ncbi:MAG TPA: hypothetical protein DDW85_00570 [Porphyromonadaceae bacterium]|jgi:hypothetical protein|nr:hypothetical protein [Porphyromonadaceae bacterium]